MSTKTESRSHIKQTSYYFIPTAESNGIKFYWGKISDIKIQCESVVYVVSQLYARIMQTNVMYKEKKPSITY